jgi:hypothetical protein
MQIITREKAKYILLNALSGVKQKNMKSCELYENLLQQYLQVILHIWI